MVDEVDPTGWLFRSFDEHWMEAEVDSIGWTRLGRPGAPRTPHSDSATESTATATIGANSSS